MLFNSIDFAIFLPLVFLLYWWIDDKQVGIKNGLLLGASYFFYACWDWRFLFLLIFSTLLDYFTGLSMQRTQSETGKKFWFWLSVIINLGFLGVFKYFNFFAETFAAAVDHLGVHLNLWTVTVILPVGISFYTFHGLSYVIDVYNRRINAERNFVDYAVFVSFFPLLVAGPIERATHLLPQIKTARTFNYTKAVDGLRQILWGLFKKVVIADNCAEYANLIFNPSGEYNGSTLVLGALMFTFQIYGDFSGYSDIALGTARLFGIELLRNFAFPYFSRDIAEFWRRWHISLSSWFRDYLYIPLGGSKGGNGMRIRNTFIIFIVSGLWHGANWTFIIWGALNALFIMPSIVMKTNRNHLETVASGRNWPSLKELAQMTITFALTTFAWILFRANNLDHAWSFVRDMMIGLAYKKGYVETINLFYWKIGFLVPLMMLLFILVEWRGREEPYALSKLGLQWKRPVRYAMYYALILSIIWFGGKEQQFIYFQF